uniref:Conotoxin Eb11.3 n=1 Tax=Conus eburneus TaxID=101300 RepID=I2B3_CONEB|nr:RecName: Full=Conotoxin Eb11.3; Flags: Precursor [Conus eburneus]ACU30729.1 I-superfamily 11.3 [Conus eburneus]
MMFRLTSVWCLLVIVLLNSAVDGFIPCTGSEGYCHSHMWCCNSFDVCCELPGPATCTREEACETLRIALGRRAQYKRFFRR